MYYLYVAPRRPNLPALEVILLLPMALIQPNCWPCNINTAKSLNLKF